VKKVNKVEKAKNDNRGNQLNPDHYEYLNCRKDNLNSASVSIIQQHETRDGGRQKLDGLGAKAQSIYDSQQKK